MRVLVCGGRYFQDVSLLWRHLDQLHAKSPITCVIEGGSDAVAGEYYGADYWARMWAKARGIPSVTEFADWDQFGRWAGPKRNKEMIDKYDPEAVIAFLGGAGTANMIKQARAAGIDVHEVTDED
jgi:YspA, cpYpsA-related SLOG family